jgi:hypothetical protein
MIEWMAVTLLEVNCAGLRSEGRGERGEDKETAVRKEKLPHW